MDAIKNAKVAAVFSNYPKHMRERLLFLRRLILDTASKTEGVGVVEETLKWGEPSYVTRRGSTVRIGWKKSSPHHYAMYFHCRTRLIDTFRELYGDRFKFAGNRAIVFDGDDDIPIDELKHCVSLALTYHDRKQRPRLGGS